MYLRKDSSETKRKILTVCVRLFLDQGYKNTSVSQIVDEAGVARGSYLNLFPTKDKILLDLTETMFGGQFGMARSIADIKLPPVYAYAVETVIQLTLTELNENLREICCRKKRTARCARRRSGHHRSRCAGTDRRAAGSGNNQRR